MENMIGFLRDRIFRDEKGAEVAEVGIWLALMVVLSITLISTLGTDIKAAFQSVVTALAGTAAS